MKTFRYKILDNYDRAEEVVEYCLHQGEDAEACCEGDYQRPGGLQGPGLLWLDFAQKRLKECVTSIYLESYGQILVITGIVAYLTCVPERYKHEYC